MGHVIVHGGLSHEEETERIHPIGLKAALQPCGEAAAGRGYAGARGSVSAAAREAGIRATQLYGWRLWMRASAPKGFAPVRIAPELPAGAGALEIEFASGARMRISGAVDIAVMAAAIAALAQGRWR